MRYELRLFMAKVFSLLKLIITSTGWGAVSTDFKVFGMTQTRTWDLPIQIRVCYYWAKSAGFSLYIIIYDIKSTHGQGADLILNCVSATIQMNLQHSQAQLAWFTLLKLSASHRVPVSTIFKVFKPSFLKFICGYEIF